VKLRKTLIGIDVIEITRIEQAVSRWHDAFLTRIYTAAELEYSRNRYASLAARFAAKEAVMKALGTGTTGMRWQDIEILSEENGKPVVRLHGKAQHKGDELGVRDFSISISHCEKYAVALVIGNAI
jgi:holo-[acyl-carrier protein] synthase